MTAGTTATSRVTSRRSQGFSRRFRNPSITIWPASVPVSVLACPLARSATANSVLAAGMPSMGESSWWASPMSATSACSVPWNTAAASTRIAALIRKAKSSDTVESMVAKRSARALPCSVRS